jgi:hypothetical protein
MDVAPDKRSEYAAHAKNGENRKSGFHARQEKRIVFRGDFDPADHEGE